MISPPFALQVTLEDLDRLAQLLAAIVRKGDVVCLSGDLGAGKTTFARFFISALCAPDVPSDIPSPSFALVQTYESSRFQVAHFDFYRLEDPADVLEIGLEDSLEEGVSVIEWPEKVSAYLPEDYLAIAFHEIEDRDIEDPDKRRLVLTGYGAWQKKLQRLQGMMLFLQQAGWDKASYTYLQGDASARSYIRLKRDAIKADDLKTNADAGEGCDPQRMTHAILMDAPKQPDGPPVRDGKPYSALAHLAEDMQPFVALSHYLRSQGLYAPEVFAHDLDHGFLLIEDLGDDVFGKKIAQGEKLFPLYKEAVHALLKLQNTEPPEKLIYAEDAFYELPLFDDTALHIEVDLLLEWYWPVCFGQSADDTIRAAFRDIWQAQFDWLQTQPTTLVLRDFHSPNLLWLDKKHSGDAREFLQDRFGPVGVIDFQDAVRGHPAYDLVSLLQDARLDVPQHVESALFDLYCTQCQDLSDFKRANFERAYALLGVQRSTKILGIFARLALRDRKPHYVQHIPRIWSYLERNLKHAGLADLCDWYETHFPKEIRVTDLKV